MNVRMFGAGAMLMMAGATFADTTLTVSRLFTDRAVLQRDAVVPIWGTAPAGVLVSLSFNGQHQTTVSDPQGRWRIDLAPMPAQADGLTLTVETADGDSRTLSDLVIGDLWLATGQSNMELGMAAIANRAQEIKDLKYPALRLYLIPKSASGEPRSEVFGVWVPSDRVSVTSGGWSGFSAVGYTFGRRIQRELGVPVGIIQAGYGGSPISAWIPPAEIAADPQYSRYAAQIQAADDTFARARRANPEARHPFDDPSDTADLGPSSIWHSMLEPLGPLAIKGALWYQGETDVGDGPFYTQKMMTLISGWRRVMNRPTLPFYFVQIAPWKGYGGDSLPRLWAAQEGALQVPGTGMALTVDVGDFDDIHPANKRPVGERLALQALAKTYGKAVNADGPVFSSWNADGRGILVLWKASSPLTTTDKKPPVGFEVFVGGVWQPVGASLVPGGVLLAAASATAVRYAWSATPLVNLTDAEGLPARPFLAER